MMIKWLYDDVITWDLSCIPPSTFICSKIMIFHVFYESVTNPRTNGPTDRPTDMTSYRDARTHLKTICEVKDKHINCKVMSSRIQPSHWYVTQLLISWSVGRSVNRFLCWKWAVFFMKIIGTAQHWHWWMCLVCWVYLNVLNSGWHVNSVKDLYI